MVLVIETISRLIPDDRALRIAILLPALTLLVLGFGIAGARTGDENT